jgi:hypothetical protein
MLAAACMFLVTYNLLELIKTIFLATTRFMTAVGN